MTDFDDDNIFMSDEPELPVVDEQDLRILKNIISNQSLAVQFAHDFDASIFQDVTRDFGHDVITYVKAYKAPPTARVLLEKASKNPEKFNEYQYILGELDKVEANPNEFKYDLEKARNRYKHFVTVSFKEAVKTADPAVTPRLIQSYQNDLNKFDNHKKAFVQKTIKDYIPEFKSGYNFKLKNPDQSHGIYTNFKQLDYITNGLIPSDMLIIAGETGAGKSVALANFVKQMWQQKNSIYEREHFSSGYHGVIFSLEMPYEQYFWRLVSSLARVPTYGIRDAKLNQEELLRVRAACEFIEAYPFQIEIIDIARGTTLKNIEERLQDTYSRFKPDFFAVDYLGLLSAEGIAASSDSDWLSLGHLAGGLHEIARVYELVCLTAAQLNRKPQGQEVVGLHRLGRSSMIAHNATHILQIETRDVESTRSDMPMHLLKCRNGPPCSFSLEKNLSQGYIGDFEHAQVEGEVIKPLTTAERADISKLLQEFNW